MPRTIRKTSGITFGPAIYLLKDGKFVHVNEKEPIRLSWGARYSCSHFNHWNENTLVISRLKNMKDLPVKIDTNPVSAANHAVSVCFSDADDEHNRMLLVKALEYIKDHHRNIVAHKDSVNKSVCEEYREMLLQSEYLLWILLYILNP